MAKKQSLDDMRDEAFRRQDNLAADIDELLDRVNPKNAVTRWKNELIGSVKSFSDAGDGKTAATLPVVVGGVIGLVVIGGGIAAAVALSRREPTRGQKVAAVMKDARRGAERSAKKARKSSLPVPKEAEKHASELGAILQEAAKRAEKKVASAGS